MGRLVPADVDLVVTEFTYNDAIDAAYTSDGRRTYEHLLRKLLKLGSAPAVIQLHHYAWWLNDGDGLDRGLFYRPTEPQLQVFANVSAAAECSASMPLLPLLPVLASRQGAGSAHTLCPARPALQMGRGDPP